MGAVVGPHAPIVVGLALGIFAVLVVEESDHLIHHRYGDRQPRAKDRPRELQREIGADAVPFQEIAQISVGLGARKVVERNPLIDTLRNALAAANIWSPLSVRAIKIRQIYNLAIPANEFVKLAELMTQDDIGDYRTILSDGPRRDAFHEFHWLPTEPGAL